MSMGSKMQDMVLYFGSTIYPIKLCNPYKALNMCGSYGQKEAWGQKQDSR